MGANRACARVNQGSSPNSLPSCTACVLRLAPSLSKTRLEWVFTVLSLTKSFSAISRLLRPWAISSRISSSRRVIRRPSDAKNGKGRGDQSAVDFDGMFDDQELILGPPEQSNQDSTDQPVHENVALHKLQEDSLPKLSHQRLAGQDQRLTGLARVTGNCEVTETADRVSKKWEGRDLR
jgi:hypothetical protein